MKHMKTIGIILIVILVLAIGLIQLFPKLFWAKHAKDTEKLQASLIQGKNEIEYAYSEDEKIPVITQHIQVDTDTAKEYVIYYPEELEINNTLYPVVVWGNGTGNTYINYEASLKSLASYGFIVIGCDHSDMGDGSTLYEMGLFARQLNDDPDSIFCSRINVDKIGVAGHSQGACGAVNAATKYPESSTLFASIYTTSLPKLEMCKDDDRYQFAYWAYDVSKISIPYFATTGTKFLDSMWISPLSSMQENFNQLGDIPAYMARQKNANHNIVNEYHAAGYFNAWFCYTLLNDETAGQAFIGQQEIKSNTDRWSDFESK